VSMIIVRKGITKMIFIERFVIFALICTFLITLILIIINHLKSEEVKTAVNHALRINSKEELKNVLIVHEKYLNSDMKARISERIDDLIIEESEKRCLERIKGIK